MSRVGAIVLAAGNSSRLGRPKQLLPYRGKTLLTHVVGEALAMDLRPLTVITGAHREEIEDVLKDEPVELVYNPDWEKGMASGIVAGLSNILLLHPDVNGVIIAVCDQPFITAALLSDLIGMFEWSGKGIIASAYAGNVGTPVLFGPAYFHQLLALTGSEGAKKLLKLYADDLVTVDFPGGEIDIDTDDDLRQLLP